MRGKDGSPKMKKGLFAVSLCLPLGLCAQLLGGQYFMPSDLGSLCLKEKLSPKEGITNYRKLGVLIAKLPEQGKRIGLTEERVRQECELSLRQAGLEPC